MNIKLGYGERKDDIPPLRAVGPVTEEEYLSREERFEKHIKEDIKVDATGKTVAEKIEIIRKYRFDQYDKVTDAAFKRRGWTKEGVPTLERLKELNIDLPELINIVKNAL